MRVLVTGATGFLGSAVCRMLSEGGEQVVAFVRKESSHPVLDALDVERIEGDVRDAESLRRALRGCDAAIHAAFVGKYSARCAAEVHAVNGQGAWSLLRACLEEGVPRVVMLDTISVFPASKGFEVREPDFEARVSAPWLFPYLDSKLEAERAAREYLDRLQIVTLHCCPMYGAGDKHGHTGTLIRHLSAGRTFLAPPGGTSVVAVSDAAAACVLAARDSCSGSFVVSAEHLTFAEIYQTILAGLGSKRRIRGVLPRVALAPLFAAAMIADRLPGESWFCPYLVRNGFHFRLFSSETTRRTLGWQPRAGFRDAVREQIDWMAANQRLAS